MNTVTHELNMSYVHSSFLMYGYDIPQCGFAQITFTLIATHFRVFQWKPRTINTKTMQEHNTPRNEMFSLTPLLILS